ncbi:MAG: molybdopterin molybdotransferase MoeA [Candidatus Binatia bacterium]|nr:molybdopterin molybdotransferase MoeA [Candidatus Binatia bacterium]MDG2008964.1 molybdopterin molybdotransferase MoeA [Candidatus Binatia bacterium]
MISIGEAIQRVLARTKTGKIERVALGDACGSTLAGPVKAVVNVPSFRNSQMDGYAVRSRETASASTQSPIRLRKGPTVAAGSPKPGELPPGHAASVMTGAALPDGADAVIPIEDLREMADGVHISARVEAGCFIRPAGIDLAAGETVLLGGSQLRPADIGLLASLGCTEVERVTPPRVAILGTGDELVSVGKPLGFGQIHDSNAHALAAAVQVCGGQPHYLGIVRDTKSALTEAFRSAATYDLVISTGGVSVGKFDYVKEVLEDLGVERSFWKVAQKPGKPVTFGQQGDGALFFGLPGNPVSAMVCFEIYVGPAIRSILGRRDLFRPTIKVVLAEDMGTSERFHELVRCQRSVVGGAVTATLAGNQNSGALHSLARADCLVLSPPGRKRLHSGEEHLALDLSSDTNFSSIHAFS